MRQLVKNQRITYGYMDPNYGGKHYGVDIISTSGSLEVVSPAPGVVTESRNSIPNSWTGGTAKGNANVLGNYIIINHGKNSRGQNVYSRFLHLRYGSTRFKAGDKVKAGDVLGLYGQTGLSYGAHLHYDIYVGDFSNRPNPMDYLSGKVLYPGEVKIPSGNSNWGGEHDSGGGDTVVVPGGSGFQPKEVEDFNILYLLLFDSK